MREACGLAVQLVNAAQAKNLPGRPRTDKLDAQWLGGRLGDDPGGITGPGAGAAPDAPVLNAVTRLAAIPGISEDLACTITAETGLDLPRFPTAGHLASWAGLCPSARQSGPRTRPGAKARAAPGCAAL